MISRHDAQMSRRTVLKGLGASLVLPFLPSLAWAQERATGVVAAPPRRFVALAFGNGVWEEDWWAKGQGAGMSLGPTLQPLQRHASDLLVLNNLHHDERLAMRHGYYFTSWLSGGQPQRSNIEAAASLDQLLAREVGGNTMLPSLHLGIEPVRNGLVNGAFAIYQATVSWSSATTPISPEVFPRQAFDRLFDTRGLESSRSVIDFVMNDMNEVRRQLNTQDRHKIDAYLDGIREVERRIELASGEGRLEGWRPTLEQPNLDRPAEDRPQSIQDHMRLMMDILVLALQMDKTRIATFVMHQDFSDMTYEFLDGVSRTGVHTISHHGHRQDSVEQYKRINRWHSEQLGYLLDRMRSIDEGNNTTLLDNTLVLYGSSLMDGDAHDINKLPILLAGGRACGVSPGRVLTFEGDDERRLSNLHLAVARRMGANISSFGNSTGELVGLAG